LAGELKSRGFEKGLQQEDFGTGGLQTFVGDEGRLASNAAGIDYNRGVQQYGINADWNDKNSQRLGNAITTAGNIFTSLGGVGGSGGSDITSALMQNSSDRRGAVTGNPYNNYAGTGGSYYPGGYKKLSGLIR
jgi:hypothetical protein